MRRSIFIKFVIRIECDIFYYCIISSLKIIVISGIIVKIRIVRFSEIFRLSSTREILYSVPLVEKGVIVLYDNL